MSSRVETPAPSETDLGALVRRMADGDAHALAALYDATSRLVYGLCSRILGNRADAEEVTLDVYSQAWRQASRFDPARGEPVTWLLTLAHSRSIDRLRSRTAARGREDSLERAAEVPSPGFDPELSSALSQRARVVRQALAALTPEQREVLELAYFEGLTHTEIAERTRQPLGTAKSRIRLGLTKLRQVLSPHAEGWPA